MLNNVIIKTIINIIKGITKVQLLRPVFWFRNPGPAPFTSIEILSCLVFFGFSFFLGVSLIVYNKWKIGRYPPKNQILNPAGLGLIFLGLPGFVFTLIRSQGITFLGVRFFPAAFIIAAVAWLLFFLHRYFKKLPAEIVKYEAKVLKRKYLDK